MLDKLTESESIIIRGTLLGALLLWGSQNLNPNPKKYSEESPESAPLVIQGVEKETEGALKAIRDLLNPKPTTEEEVEMCKEYLTDAEAIDPMVDPEGYLEVIRDFQGCKAGVSANARIKLGEESARYEPIKSYLLRCTPPGESFSMEHLEACEEVEERWVYHLSDELERNGIELSPEYFDAFEYSEPNSSWEMPGFGFELDSEDGSFHGTYQFTVHNERDGSWGYFMEKNSEYYDDTTPDEVPFVHAPSPSKITSAFMYEYSEMLARDDEAVETAQ